MAYPPSRARRTIGPIASRGMERPPPGRRLSNPALRATGGRSRITAIADPRRPVGPTGPVAHPAPRSVRLGAAAGQTQGRSRIGVRYIGRSPTIQSWTVRPATFTIEDRLVRPRAAPALVRPPAQTPRKRTVARRARGYGRSAVACWTAEPSSRSLGLIRI